MEYTSPEADTLYTIKERLDELTGGCESCLYLDGRFCERHGKMVGVGSPRCEFFARRLDSHLEEDQRKITQDYVNQILGLKGKYSKRLIA